MYIINNNNNIYIYIYIIYFYFLYFNGHMLNQYFYTNISIEVHS